MTERQTCFAFWAVGPVVLAATFWVGYVLGQGDSVDAPAACGRCGERRIIYNGSYSREFSCGNEWYTTWTYDCDATARPASAPATTYFHPKQATAETMEGGKPGTIYEEWEPKP